MNHHKRGPQARAEHEANRAARLHEFVRMCWPGLKPTMPSWSKRVKQAAMIPSRVLKVRLKKGGET